MKVEFSKHGKIKIKFDKHKIKLRQCKSKSGDNKKKTCNLGSDKIPQKKKTKTRTFFTKKN